MRRNKIHHITVIINPIGKMPKTNAARGEKSIRSDAGAVSLKDSILNVKGIKRTRRLVITV